MILIPELTCYTGWGGRLPVPAAKAIDGELMRVPVDPLSTETFIQWDIGDRLSPWLGNFAKYLKIDIDNNI